MKKTIVAFIILFGCATNAIAASVTTFKIDMNRPAKSCQGFTKILGQFDICAVTGPGGEFSGGGENGTVTFENGSWIFRGNSCEPGVFFHLSCYKL